MSGIPPFKPYVPDRNLMFGEAVVMTATGNVQFAAADVILKIGRGRMDATLILNITTMKVSATNELYDFWIQGCDVSDFSGGASGIVNLAHVQVGAVAALSAGAGISGGVGARVELDFNNVLVGNAMYDYIRLRAVIAGTAPTITFDAWVAVDAE